MTARVATCCCGQLELICEAEPVRVSVCHCPACQKRTGATFGVQARFPDDAVRVEGRVREWTRHVDDGDEVLFRFCPECGSTVYWQVKSLPGFTTVAVGAFGDPGFPAPRVSVWEANKHPWVVLPPDVERYD